VQSLQNPVTIFLTEKPFGSMGLERAVRAERPAPAPLEAPGAPMFMPPIPPLSSWPCSFGAFGWLLVRCHYVVKEVKEIVQTFIAGKVYGPNLRTFRMLFGRRTAFDSTITAGLVAKYERPGRFGKEICRSLMTPPKTVVARRGVRKNVDFIVANRKPGVD